VYYRIESLSEAEVDEWLKCDRVQRQISAIHNGEVNSWRLKCALQNHQINEDLNYVMDVLVPEAVVHLIMDKTGV
jgi:hypothetical protein